MGQGPRHGAFYWFEGAGLALCSPEQGSRKLSGSGGSLSALDSSGGCVRFALTADTRAQSPGIKDLATGLPGYPAEASEAQIGGTGLLSRVVLVF